MHFNEFNKMMQQHVAKMIETQQALFVVDVDKDELWNLYLDSYPEGTNSVFRVRREYDCSCCRHFVRSFGNVVALKGNQMVTVWDFKTGDHVYQPVVDALAAFVKKKPVSDVFVAKSAKFGTKASHELLDDGSVRAWDHFYVEIPADLVTRSTKSEASIMGEIRDIRNVFQRSLEEISTDAIETVLDLISQGSLYKGEEWKNLLDSFSGIHKKYHKLGENQRDAYCWSQATTIGGAIGKIRNHSIGTLLLDVTADVDIDVAVRKYEAIVAPSNYKRPKAIFTKKMLEQAQETLKELGLLGSLGRRYAIADDITINNVLFANRDTAKRMTCGDVFEEMQQDIAVNPKSFDKVEEVPIDRFLNDVLPRATSMEVLPEARHTANLVSLIAPEDVTAPTLFKWNNGFSWAYNGNIADSMRARVKAFGGRVENVVSRFTIQWNEDLGNNDLDAHCMEPDGNCIYFPTAGQTHRSSGSLDVDFRNPNVQIKTEDKIAVENIIHTRREKMPDGEYEFLVHCYSNRGGRGGFSAELELDGKIFKFDYPHSLHQNQIVSVARVLFSKTNGFKVVESLQHSASSQTVWGIKTNQLNPVSTCMFSPNYWDEQHGIGHKHYFFMLSGCKNDGQPNGFFNEFLREDLAKHKRVFEALGGKMAVKPSDEQLSGLGFSSTKRDSLLCKLAGNVSRTIRIVF